jgi:hypothetical protein
MGEAASSFGLTQKPLAKFGECFTRLMGKRNALDRDRAINLWIASSVYNTHRSSPDFVEDLVSPEASITKGIHPAVFVRDSTNVKVNCSPHFLSSYVRNGACTNRVVSRVSCGRNAQWLTDSCPVVGDESNLLRWWGSANCGNTGDV